MRHPGSHRTIFALLATAVVGLALAAPTEAGPRRAPHFAVRDLDGKTFKLKEVRGHPVVVDFWATWCRPCRASMPHLDAVQERYREHGLIVLGISLDELDPGVVRRYAHRLGVRFRLAMANDEVLDLYGPIRYVPTTYFIDRNGWVVRRVVGYVDGDLMDRYASELVAEAPKGR